MIIWPFNHERERGTGKERDIKFNHERERGTGKERDIKYDQDYSLMIVPHFSTPCDCNVYTIIMKLHCTGSEREKKDQPRKTFMRLIFLMLWVLMTREALHSSLK